MADMKKCDKCGVIFMPEDQACGLVHLRVYNSNHSSWPSGNNYDFCPTCMYKIEKLLLEGIE